MKKNLVISFLSTLFSICSLYGQADLQNFYRKYLEVKRSGPSYATNIAGSPYENSEFMKAEVFMKGSENPVMGIMRYNSFEDEMEFEKDNGEVLVLVNKNNLDSIHLYNKTFRYLKLIEDKTVQKGYFVQLSYGECQLFKKIRKSFQEEKSPTSGYDQYVPAAFIKEHDEFYVRFGDQPLFKIPRRNKKIKEMFRENGYVNKKMSRVKYDEKSLIIFFSDLKKLSK